MSIRVQQLLLLSLALPAAAPAQGVTSDIRGIIADQSGGVIAGAAIKIDNVTKGWSRVATSGSDGEYLFLQLPPADTYNLAVTFSGFRTEKRSGIVLQTGQQGRFDFVLAPGDVSDSVNVEAGGSLVQSETASVGAVVDEHKVKELPLNGRQFWQLAQLIPNVFPPTQNSTLGFRGGFNVSGHQEYTNNYVLDGVDNSDGATLQPTNRPSVDGIQEFKVLSGVYNAEYGRYSGGQILVTTKSGSNEFHGTAYEFLRNSALDARNFFSPAAVPAFRRNQFGGSNGGRIVRNRTFYFATYEGLRLSSQTTGLTTVPTAALASGSLNGLTGTIKDPTTNAPFPGNIIPADRISPVSRGLLKYFPAPTGAGLTNNYTFSELGTEQDDQFSGRIDQIVTSRNNLFVSYQFAQRTTFYPSNTACALRFVPSFGCTEPERDQGISVSDVHVFSPSLVNELRLGFNRIRTNRNIEDAKFGNVDRDLGIPQNGNGVEGNLGLPQVSITGFATIGGSSGLPNGRRDNTYNLIENLSWIHGAHTFKFGADYKRFIYNYMTSSWASSRGSFTFNGLYSGNAFADFLLGAIRSTSQNPGDPAVRSYTPSAGFYAQDEWKIARNVTLSYGLRYELFFPERERLNKIASFDPATGLVPVSTGQLLNVDSTGALINVGTSNIGPTAWKLQTTNFAPRFGIAWRPFADSRTVVRGGYGIFYNLLPDGNGISQLFRGIPFRANQTFTNTATQQLATWTNPYPSNVGVAVGGYTPNGVAYDLKTPYVQQWSFGLEREIAHDLVLETTYLGSKGTHLLLSRNLNQPAPGPGAIQARRPYPQWGSITWVDAVGTSTYHSLAVRLERRYSNGLSLLASYTYSHSIDQGGGSGDGESAIQDPRNIAANTGSSDFDIRHRLVTSIVYQLPFGKGRGLGGQLPALLRAPISNWETTAIVTLQSGPPFSVVTSTDISNTGGANRPFLVGDPSVLDPSPTRWFNTAAFSITLPPGVYSYGNLGRNTLRADGTQNLDLGIFRNFALREKLGLQFRGEIFNVLNHPNFGLPIHDASSSTFGQVTQTSTASRQIQFGLKLVL
jgi:Carboxypeptidase regulatory-like domain/TonB dependent receptor/TonB-dependent Receptor Plug Domain